MAPTAALVAAGGTDDGRIGTSFDLVSAGIGEADSGDGVVVLCDLGSAILTAETALDFLDDDVRARVRIVDAPLVEGGVAAAVAAEAGDAARRRWSRRRSRRGATARGRAAPTAPRPRPRRGASGGAASGSFAHRHPRERRRTARPPGGGAGEAREHVPAAGHRERHRREEPARASCRSASRRARQVEIASERPDGREAVDAIAALAESGFGET